MGMAVVSNQTRISGHETVAGENGKNSSFPFFDFGSGQAEGFNPK